MREVVLYIAMSLDGYIADSEGGVAWLSGDGSQSDNEGTYAKFYDTIDTIILGYTTYHQVLTELSPDAWVYEGKKCYVVTHRQALSNPNVEFTAENLDALISRLKSTEGRDIWICGGAKIANQLINKGLIDRYHIAVIPTILGGGTRLFEDGVVTTELCLIATESYNGITELTYRPRK